MCRSLVSEEDCGRSLVAVECTNVRLLELVRISDGEGLSDSNARIVTAWASMIDPAMRLSEVFLL